MSAYCVFCDCGRSHRVSATQAGSTLPCSCGRTVAVPSLSSLRASLGESAIPLNVIERIEIMIRNGELPVGDLCPLSGHFADDTIRFRVQCESRWMRKGNSSDTPRAVLCVALCGVVGDFYPGLALLLFLISIGVWMVADKVRLSDEHGRETFVIVPLRVSSEARPNILRTRRQKNLKALLSHTPIYSELLKQYPSATVSVNEIATASSD